MRQKFLLHLVVFDELVSADIVIKLLFLYVLNYLVKGFREPFVDLQ